MPPATAAPAGARAEADASPRPHRAFTARLGDRGRRWMTALGKLFRTTTFKLTLVYLTVFALFAAVLIGYFAWTTSSLSKSRST